MNIKKLPLSLAKANVKLHLDIKKLVEDNNEFICIESESYEEIYIKDRDANSNFFFNLYNPHIGVFGPYFTTLVCPQSDLSNEPLERQFSDINVISVFNKWIDNVKGYSSISYSNDYLIVEKYFEEHTSFFDIPEGEDNDVILSINQQVLLYEYFVKSLEYANEQSLDEISQEILSTQQDLGMLTKRQAITRLNKILSKARAKSIKLFIEMIRLLASEGLSFVIQNALTMMTKG